MKFPQGVLFRSNSCGGRCFVGLCKFVSLFIVIAITQFNFRSTLKNLEAVKNRPPLFWKTTVCDMVNLIEMKNAWLPPSTLQVQMWDCEITM